VVQLLNLHNQVNQVLMDLVMLEVQVKLHQLPLLAAQVVEVVLVPQVVVELVLLYTVVAVLVNLTQSQMVRHL
jgi:hypothetical protein